MTAIGMSFLMSWLGLILWLGAECNQNCRIIYSSVCDIPAGAKMLGGIFAIITFVLVVSGVYDKQNKGD